MTDIGLIEVFLHLDRYLPAFAQEWGVWIYAVLFLIIFVETGLVIMPFLPGDSLLFVAGAVAAVGGMQLEVLLVLLTTAAILGDSVNYAIGRRVGPRVFSWEQSRWFNREAFNKTHTFYERYGPLTIVVARFLPFLRTFAPFVGGIAEMHYPKFLTYNIVGGVLWVGSLTTLGYLIGEMPWVKANFSLVTLAMIIIPGLPAVWVAASAWLEKRKQRQ